MTPNLPATQLSHLSQLVARHLGLHFPPERWPDLERGVCDAAEECHLAVEDLLAGRQMELLARHITTGETYFFREIRSLQILQQRIVPDLLAGKRCKIWSAGCSTGEEPYSLAIMLNKMARLPERSIEILATDINATSLSKAAEGIYTNWSFRGTPPWVQRTCFHATEDGRWAIDPAIRSMVHFATLNLMEDAYSPPSNQLDVIFCRNVLMYFTPEGRRKVIQQFHRCLAADGWLVVGAAETSQELFCDFARVCVDDVTLYQKSAQRIPVTVTVAFDHDDRPMAPPPARRIPLGPAQVAEPVASYPQALALYQQGRYEEAGKMTAALLSQHPSDPPTLLLLARIHANQGNLTQALTWCDRAIAADKMAARAHYLRAAILQEQSSLPEAILSLNQAVYADPACVMSHFALGNLAWRHGKLKQSEKHFENVLLLLARYQPEEIVPESEGLSAAKLRELIARTRAPEAVKSSRH